MVAFASVHESVGAEGHHSGTGSPPVIQIRPLLAAEEVARILGVGERTVWRMASRARGGAGDFPRPLRIAPQVVRWRWEDVQKYLAELARN
jgi:predicted DNA-binding transcriptional regulator AlpA